MHAPQQRPIQAEAAWLNGNVIGMGLTSLLSDVGHEMITTLLPGFLAVLGVSAAALGTIEGVADSVSSFVKLGSGWASDRLGHRKPMAVVGYLFTGFSNGLFALAHGASLVLAARTLGWFGRGFRTPLRNAILAGSVPAAARGKAFGFERAGDTVGAIVGPLLAVGLLAYLHPRAPEVSAPFRTVFWISLLPGLGAALAFATLVKDGGREHASAMSLWGSMRVLPHPFRRFLWGAGIFGIGDFARTLMILAVTQLLAPRRGVEHAAQIAGLLYVGHNVAYAAFSYPVGALSDRLGRRGLLALGYFAGALAALGFLIAFLWRLDVVIYLLTLFTLAGLSIAAVDALESAFTADLVSEPLRGTAYGVLGTVNGIGDLVASVMVGLLWTAGSPVLAFAYGALLMGLGAWVLYRIR
jgi:MFS family permease